jgi:hypothetical protein
MRRHDNMSHPRSRGPLASPTAPCGGHEIGNVIRAVSDREDGHVGRAYGPIETQISILGILPASGALGDRNKGHYRFRNRSSSALGAKTGVAHISAFRERNTARWQKSFFRDPVSRCFGGSTPGATYPTDVGLVYTASGSCRSRIHRPNFQSICVPLGDYAASGILNTNNYPRRERCGRLKRRIFTLEGAIVMGCVAIMSDPFEGFTNEIVKGILRFVAFEEIDDDVSIYVEPA